MKTLFLLTVLGAAFYLYQSESERTDWAQQGRAALDSAAQVIAGAMKKSPLVALKEQTGEKEQKQREELAALRATIAEQQQTIAALEAKSPPLASPPRPAQRQQNPLEEPHPRAYKADLPAPVAVQPLITPAARRAQLQSLRQLAELMEVRALDQITAER